MSLDLKQHLRIDRWYKFITINNSPIIYYYSDDRSNPTDSQMSSCPLAYLVRGTDSEITATEIKIGPQELDVLRVWTEIQFPNTRSPSNWGNTIADQLRRFEILC